MALSRSRESRPIGARRGLTGYVVVCHDTSMTTTSIPRTTAPTDAEWEGHRRWAVPPVGTRRGMWVEREAQAIFTARTGRADPWPSMEDYAAANAVIPPA